MSTSSYIKLKKGRAKVPSSHDPYGDTYPYIREHLDKLAKKLKVESPMGFEYEDAEFYDEMFDGEIPEKIQSRLKKQKEWHEASAGLKTFESLLEHVRAKGDAAVPDEVDLKSLIYELEAFHLILQDACKKKTLFRIESLV